MPATSSVGGGGVPQARWHLGLLSANDNVTARQTPKEAIIMDSGIAGAHAARPLCGLMDMLHRWNPAWLVAIAHAWTAATKGAELDDLNANAFGMWGIVDAVARDFE